jgi:hypothetical protein
MTKEELATLLNGRQYGHEITTEEEAQAKESGLVVIFGASDDLMELKGAINDEADAYEGGMAHLTSEGLLRPPDDNCSACDDCPHFQKVLGEAVEVKALWWKEENGYLWNYETELPHVSFDILDGDEKYCRGIVMELPK